MAVSLNWGSFWGFGVSIRAPDFWKLPYGFYTVDNCPSPDYEDQTKGQLTYGVCVAVAGVRAFKELRFQDWDMQRSLEAHET